MAARASLRATFGLIAIVGALFLPISSPASANLTGKAWNEDSRSYSEGWPWPKLPNWWMRPEKWYSSQTFTDVRLGQWLPCRAEWSMNDCIEAINVYDKDGKNLGALTYIKEPNFNPFETRQNWSQVPAQGSSELLDNYSDFFNPDSTWTQGWWQLPESMILSDGKNLVSVNVHRMLSAVQMNITPRDLDKGVSLPVGIYFEGVLKSKNLKKYARWVTSTGKDPVVQFKDDGTIVIRGVTSKFPNPGKTTCDKLTVGNGEKALSSAAFVAVNLSTARDYESASYTSIPGEVIIGTNGWWCLGGIKWNAKERQIEVEVAATHFFEDGVTEVDGWLELKLKGQLVKHWWGIAPREATGFARVELLYKDGSTKIATVNAKYVPESDWIDLRAYGFTYSNPVLKISLKRPEAAIKIPSPLVKNTPKITCVKGKVTKKIAARSCPRGYKKK